MHLELTADEALHFAHNIRNARSKALADAEGWQDLVFTFERLVKHMTRCLKTTLGADEAKLVLLHIIQHGQNDGCPSYLQLELLLQQVTIGRNSEFHGGAAARRFARHCLEFSFLLEEGLKYFMKNNHLAHAVNLRSVMSSPVICLKDWQMLAEARRLMLENSFTWVPLENGKTWKVLSDHALVKFLECNRKSLFTKTIKEVLADSNDLQAPDLAIFNQDTETLHKPLIDALARGPVLVSAEHQSPDHVVGIVTAFDLL